MDNCSANVPIDFQYTVTRVEAHEIYELANKKIQDNATVYIATDERKKEFFQPLRLHYDVVFLDDFMDVLEGVNSNYYGEPHLVQSHMIRRYISEG